MIFCSHGSSNWIVLVTALGNNSPKILMNFCNFSELCLLTSVNFHSAFLVLPPSSRLNLKVYFLFLTIFHVSTPSLFVLYFSSFLNIILSVALLDSPSIFFEFLLNFFLFVTLLISLFTFCYSVVLLFSPVSFTVTLFCEHPLSALNLSADLG